MASFKKDVLKHLRLEKEKTLLNISRVLIDCQTVTDEIE